MRYNFSMIIKAEDSIKEKFEKALADHPGLHMDLIKSFANAIMLGLRLDETDKVVIEHFSANPIADPLPSQDELADVPPAINDDGTDVAR